MIRDAELSSLALGFVPDASASEGSCLKNQFGSAAGLVLLRAVLLAALLWPEAKSPGMSADAEPGLGDPMDVATVQEPGLTAAAPDMTSGITRAPVEATEPPDGTSADPAGAVVSEPATRSGTRSGTQTLIARADAS